jgi:hypothetical protein
VPAAFRRAAINDAETRLRFVGQSPAGMRGVVPAGAKVRDMLADFRDWFDVVVLDLPPMEAGGITMLLSDMVDGLVLTTRWGSTPQPVLLEALPRPAATDGLFLVTLLTGCDPARMRLDPRDQAQLPFVRAPVPMEAAG